MHTSDDERYSSGTPHTAVDSLEAMPHGTRILAPNGHVLVMNQEYPRPAFDVFIDGTYEGYLYPHHLVDEYGTDGTVRFHVTPERVSIVP